MKASKPADPVTPLAPLAPPLAERVATPRSLRRSAEMFGALSAVMAGGVGSADRVLVAPHPIFPLGGYVQGTNTLFGLGFGPGPVQTAQAVSLLHR
jgi:hypothetical protein